ncbi:phage major capsid protein [Aminobacter aminovorans]|uniref:HK97 family phage major capsid protein n=1 Tax=Aminobacter aminovorans TaxID=83263 RepID=A0AAC8YNA4_AMIAI|nr:phage major capsid protein [Aminobacter aminovorans]AMS41169.1 Phage major capsid protein, HK97 family [Aminobacter aminovorans]MBB3705849.1 HK97 family phage major capsid protein [Aminobacter aminovorans]
MTKHLVLAGSGLLSSAAFFGPITMDAASAITALEERRQELIDASQALVDAADEAETDISAEDLATIEANAAEAEKLEKQINARKALLPQGQGRRTTPEPTNRNEPNGGQRKIPANPRNNDPRGGFRSFGEFAICVNQAARNPGQVDQRLANAATTYGNEGTGADGGWAVPQEFRRGIWQKVMSDENLLTRCDRLETGANNMTVPKDETTPWQTTGGIQVYWEGEGSAATASKPSLEMSTIRLNKLMALVPVSEELLEDAPGLESWLRSKAPMKMTSKINTAIIDGSGAGQPLGILRSTSVISVAKETSQPADTIYFANINKMWSRLYAPLRRNAVWLINQDIEPQLDGMAFDPAATAGKVPVYLPANGLSASPYASLKGRPVIPVEACKTLGDKGDIILTDLSQYMALTKAGQDIKTDVSMHLYFDQALQAFRFIFRVNGQPWWGSAISPENGTTTRSWAVTLDERA